jgi:hypothetical protein
MKMIMNARYVCAAVLVASLLGALFAFGNNAHAGWGAPFVGGMVAGHVATNMAIQQRKNPSHVKHGLWRRRLCLWTACVRGPTPPVYAAPHPCVQ